MLVIITIIVTNILKYHLPYELHSCMTLYERLVLSIFVIIKMRTAGELEAACGSELRRPPFADVYTSDALRAALAARRPRVVVSAKACSNWLSLHRPGGRFKYQ